MEFNLLFSTIIAAIFLAIVIALLFNKKRDGKKKTPPKAKGAWPIIGHLHLLLGSRLPHHVFGDMADRYGPIFTVKLGVHQAVVVSNAEVAKECCTTNDKILSSRPKSKAVELMGYNYAMVGFAPYGEYWRQVRRVFTLEILSPRRVELLGHIRVFELKACMNGIYEAWVKNKQNESDMVKVEMKKYFDNMMLNVIVGIIAGKRFPLDDEEGVRFQSVVKKFFRYINTFVVSDFIPYLKGYDFGGYEKKMKMVAKDMDTIFGGWLEEHKKKRESAGEQHESNQVFMDVLISILQDASEQEFPGFDHDTLIKSSCLSILTAGWETTSITLTWALSLLLNNPKTLKIAQDEMDEHVGRERPVEESDTKNLVYLEAIIKETLRLYPPGPLAVPHQSTEDCIVSGYNIPKGTRLVLNLSKIQRDPNIWSDPDDFRPERFMTDQKDIDLKGKHFELIPFGSGRRMCPGTLFSLQALRLILATLIQRYELKNASDVPIDMSESAGITAGKVTPLEVLLAPRLSLNMYPIAA